MVDIFSLAPLPFLISTCYCSPVSVSLPLARPITQRASDLEGIPGPPPDPTSDQGSGAHGSQEPTQADRDYWNTWPSRAKLADAVAENNAARHMFHYLNNTGKDLVFSTDHMYDQGAIFGNRLASGVIELALGTEAKAAHNKATVGERQVIVFSTAWQAPGALWGINSLDWFLVVGGFSWSVAGVVTAKRDRAGYRAWLRYVVYAVDRYNTTGTLEKGWGSLASSPSPTTRIWVSCTESVSRASTISEAQASCTQSTV